MQITPSNLSFFFSSLETRFWTAYGTAPKWIDRVATTVPCPTEQWVSGWENMLAVVREWTGGRTVHTPGLQTYVVQIQNFELTYGVDQFKIMDDTYGIYYPTVSMMGENIAKWPDYQMRDLLQNTGSQTGTRQYGLDGGAHWSASHPVDYYDAAKGTYCNDFGTSGVSVNGVTVGGYLSPTAFSTLWEHNASLKSESGEALGIIPDLTMVPPQLKQPAQTILQTQFFAPQSWGGTTMVGATENVLKGWTDILVVPDLAAAPTAWYMLTCNRPMKPFTWLLNMAPNFVYRIQPDDPVVFDQHTYLYGSVMRGAPAWSHAWLSSRSGV